MRVRVRVRVRVQGEGEGEGEAAGCRLQAAGCRLQAARHREAGRTATQRGHRQVEDALGRGVGARLEPGWGGVGGGLGLGLGFT
jgi:hypothetical protein